MSPLSFAQAKFSSTGVERGSSAFDRAARSAGSSPQIRTVLSAVSKARIAASRCTTILERPVGDRLRHGGRTFTRLVGEYRSPEWFASARALARELGALERRDLDEIASRLLYDCVGRHVFATDTDTRLAGYQLVFEDIGPGGLMPKLESLLPAGSLVVGSVDQSGPVQVAPLATGLRKVGVQPKRSPMVDVDAAIESGRRDGLAATVVCMALTTLDLGPCGLESLSFELMGKSMDTISRDSSFAVRT